jgi:hypothetical protein
MNSKPTSRGIFGWLLFVLKWAIAPLAILMIVLVGVFTTLEMNREIPVPDAVKRVEDERKSAQVVQPQMLSREGVSTKDETASAESSQRSENSDVAPVAEVMSPPLIPETADAPEGSNQIRVSLNETFAAELERRLAGYERDKERIPFLEGELLLSQLNWEINDFFGEYDEYRRHVGHPIASGDTIASRLNSLSHDAYNAGLDNCVRHEQWQTAASWSGGDEDIYYFQQIGGVVGALEIAGTVIGRGLKKCSDGIDQGLDFLKGGNQ